MYQAIRMTDKPYIWPHAWLEWEDKYTGKGIADRVMIVSSCLTVPLLFDVRIYAAWISNILSENNEDGYWTEFSFSHVISSFVSFVSIKVFLHSLILSIGVTSNKNMIDLNKCSALAMHQAICESSPDKNHRLMGALPGGNILNMRHIAVRRRTRLQQRNQQIIGLPT